MMLAPVLAAAVWGTCPAYQPGGAAGAELLAAHLVSGASGAYAMALRGYQLAAWALGAGVLP